MNEFTENSPAQERELHELELATARQLPANVRLSAETAALREGYLALAQLLESAAEPAPPALALPPRVGSLPMLVGALAALAATLVVGVFAWRALFSANPAPALPGTPHVAVTTPDEPKKKLPNLVPAPETHLPATVPALASSSLAWDDAFDTALSEAGEQIWNVRHNSFTSSSTYTSFSGRLEQLGQELEAESL